MRALALSLAVLFGGCVIVVDEKKVPVPVPVPVPTSGPFAGDGKDGDPGMDLLFLVRIDHGTANLADAIDASISEIRSKLADEGARIRNTAVASLYDGQLLWVGGVEAPPPASLADTLRYWSARDRPAPDRCTTEALAAIGQYFEYVEATYPSDLYAPGTLPTDFRLRNARPFATMPGALLVGLIDSGPRPFDPASIQCKEPGGEPAAHFGGADPVAWIRRSNGQTLPLAHTRFLFISTPEGTSAADMAKACADQKNFPRAGIDALAPSDIAFFDVTAKAMNEPQPGLVARHDLCEALGSEAWPDTAKAFAKDWIDALRREAAQK